MVFTFVPMIEKEMTGGKAVTVYEDQMFAAGGADRIVENDVLPPPPVFMPEMDDGVEGIGAGFRDDVPDLWPGTVVGNDNLKGGEGLA
jgi:hypothetical protein